MLLATEADEKAMKDREDNMLNIFMREDMDGEYEDDLWKREVRDARIKAAEADELSEDRELRETKVRQAREREVEDLQEAGEQEVHTLCCLICSLPCYTVRSVYT
jgi:hypothetical protein